MIEDSYYDYEEDYPINNGPNLKKIVFIALSVIIGIIILLVIISINKVDKNSYAYIEKQMVKEAKKYVMNNNITSDSEIYLDTQMLNFTLPDTCNLTSGVLFQDDYYKPYLSCSDYESKILNNSNKVRLNGKEITVIYYGMNFHDPGYSSYENVKVSGLVGKEPGVYNLYYISQNSQEVAIRKVIIIDNKEIRDLYPMIEINGNKVEVITKGSYYNDNGAVAFDKTDGDISNRITVSELPNTSNVGEYNVSYMVQNSLGYYNSITRQVVVVENESELNVLAGLDDDNLTNESVNIVLNIIGTNYQYTILPNGEQNKEKSFSYEVNENGTYLFSIVDNNNNIIEKEVIVENIRKEKPTAICNAILYNDKTSITVSSNANIINYRYHIGNISSSYLVSNSYIGGSTNSSSVTVDIRDIVGNENTIVCAVIDNKYEMPSNPIIIGPTYDTNGFRKTIKGNALHTKLTTALSSRGYTIDSLNNCIASRVRNVGPGTRYGVVEAGIGLIECMQQMTGNVVSYDHWGGKIDQVALNGKLGVNPRWGTETEGNSSSCASSSCYLGLDCASFVRWAMCNGGMNFCSKKISSAEGISTKTYFPEADSFRIKDKKVYHNYGNNLTNYSKNQLLGMLKPGDIIFTPKPTESDQNHVMLVVGIESDAIYIAENGSRVRKIMFSTFTSGGSDNTFFLLDRFYANSANRNNLY